MPLDIMASKRLEKYRQKNVEVNNNIYTSDDKGEENPILSRDKEKLPVQTPQDLIREWFKCICYRPNTDIMCSNRNCSFRAFGRVRRLCRAHPKVTYLLDLQMCPDCLQRVDELPHERSGN